VIFTKVAGKSVYYQSPAREISKGLLQGGDADGCRRELRVILELIFEWVSTSFGYNFIDELMDPVAFAVDTK
jgi:hypothetical protein